MNEVRNVGIVALHSSGCRSEPINFKGTLTEVKAKAQEILSQQEGIGWKVIAGTDNETLYCCYNSKETVIGE